MNCNPWMLDVSASTGHNARHPERRVMSSTYTFPRPSVTVDVVLFGVDAELLRLLLIRRASPPFAGRWALPGGFLDMDEDLVTGARRELHEETGVRLTRLEQLGAYGKPGRDPRGRTVSVAFVGLFCGQPLQAEGRDDASEARWFTVNRLPGMAFDHRCIIRDARDRLRRSLQQSEEDVLLLLAGRFAVKDLATVYEALLERPVSASRLRRRLVGRGLIHLAGKRSNSSRRLYKTGKAVRS